MITNSLQDERMMTLPIDVVFGAICWRSDVDVASINGSNGLESMFIRECLDNFLSTITLQQKEKSEILNIVMNKI